MAHLLRTVKDWPKPGVDFVDISPLLNDPQAFRKVIMQMSVGAPTKVLALDSRGFLFGPGIASACEAGLVMARKPGKLPAHNRAELASATYAKEYGTDTLEVLRCELGPGDRVLVVDDVIATGGSAAAATELVRACGATPIGVSVLLDVPALRAQAREALGDVPLSVAIKVDEK